MTEDITDLAGKNQLKAKQVIKDCKIIEAWQSIGAEINLVGSLRMGLLITHRDIEFHLRDQCPGREEIQGIHDEHL